MTEVYIDGVKQAIPAITGTWGDLLAILDDRVTAQHLLVTAVRLDGVEEPAFRHPAAAIRPLVAIGRVEVETAEPKALLRQSCVDAAEGAADMAGRVLQLAALFQADDLQAAHAGLTGIADDLRIFATLLYAIRESPGLEQEWQAVGESGPREQLQDLVGCLGALVDAQAASDWITVSDVLQYDLEPALRRWERQLHAVAA